MGGVPAAKPTGGFGERHELPQQSLGHSLSWKRILSYFEGHRTLFLHLYADVLSSSNSVSCHIREGSAELWGQFPVPHRRTAFVILCL